MTRESRRGETRLDDASSVVVVALFRVAPGGSLAVGDQRRRAVRRAVFSTLLVVAVFVLFTVPTKQVQSLYEHGPWANDPYDTVYSFAMFFVPLLGAAMLVPIALCRTAEPLPVVRVISVLRACRFAPSLVAITLGSCWLSVALGADRSDWTPLATGGLIAFLVLATLLTVKAVVDLRRAPKLAMPAPGEDGTDWVGDLVCVTARETRWLGPLRPVGLRAIDRLDRSFIGRLRDHPVRGACVFALVFGVVLLNQSVREHYAPGLALVTVAVLTCGMFAFLMAVASPLNLVRSTARLSRGRRRAVDAVVGGCVAAIATLAFRDALWWLIGSTANAAGSAELAVLLAVAMITTFATVLAIKS